MAVPRQMTAHTLEAHKGWPRPHAVDFTAKLSANVTFDPLFAGRCVHVNDSGEYQTGVPDASPGAKLYMPIFVFQNSDDPDVDNPGGITGAVNDDPGGWMAVAPTGQIMGLVATGAYELETTEFVDTVSYLPNDALKSTNDDSDADVGGKLSKGTVYTNHIVGTVSRASSATAPTTKNSHGKRVLSFWPVTLPPTS